VQQDQSIKGFTILELLVVVTIVMIVSAVAYPNFSSWSKDRDVRKGAERVSTMLSTITASVQRGNYSFVQFMIIPQGSNETTFHTRGLQRKGYTRLLKKRNSQNTQIICSLKNDDWKSNLGGNPEIQKITVKGVVTHLTSTSSVCFSKNAAHYSTSSGLSQRNLIFEKNDHNRFIIVCNSDLAKTNGGKCPLKKSSGLTKPAYLIEWSRFGQIQKYKFNGDEWIRN